MKRKEKISLSNELNDLEEVDPNIYTHSATPTCPLIKSTVSLATLDKLPSCRAAHNLIGTEPANVASLQQSQIYQSGSEARDASMNRCRQQSLGNQQSASKMLLKLFQSKKQLPCKNKRAVRQTKLKQIIKREKVKVLKNQFINKIRRNNTHSAPVQFDIYQNKKESFLQNEGFQITPSVDNVVTLLSIFQITLLFILYTLALVFPEIQNTYAITFLQFFSLIFYFLQIVYNLVTVKSKGGRKLHTFQQILHYYLRDFLVIDFLNLLILIIDLSCNTYLFKYLRLFLVMKLPQCLQKIQKLQAFFVKNYYNEQYWSLIKVMLFNFCFAHILAIFLTAVAKIDTENNWYNIKNIHNAQWFQKYVWAYYWGVNIMLTVGFGDIIPTTYQQAICLIFIQIISVMCLAYNVNWIGTLISNIRLQDLEKSKNFKTFKQLSQKYQLPDELQWRINNYINQSVNIRKKFNIEQEHSFIKSLPETLKKQYLQESNKSIFQQLPFFSTFIDKTLYQFAYKIEMSISHPQQPLKRIQDHFDLLILREGEVGFVAKKRNCGFNGAIIDRMKVYGEQKPFILGLQFLTNERPAYEIKSLQYSVIYTLQYQTLINILKDSHLDYEHFCSMRDKSKSMVDEFEVLKCSNCENQKHTKFSCPRLHFTPLKQVIIFKEQNNEKKAKNMRNMEIIQRSAKKTNALKVNKEAKQNLQDLRSLASNNSIIFKRASELNTLSYQPTHFVQYTQNSLKTISSLIFQQKILKNTSEAIRQQFDKMSKFENCEDEVWLISCDRMKNYQQYFAQSNPSLLQENFSLTKRIKKFRNMLSRSINRENNTSHNIASIQDRL